MSGSVAGGARTIRIPPSIDQRDDSSDPMRQTSALEPKRSTVDVSGRFRVAAAIH